MMSRIYTLDIPHVHQIEDYGCGLACFRSLLKFSKVEEIVKATNPMRTVRGIKPNELAKLAKAHKMYCQQGIFDLDRIRRHLELEHPIICPIQIGNPEESHNGHYIIVRGLTKSEVKVHDPSYGDGVYSRKSFLERWHDVDREGVEYKSYGIVIWKR